MKKTNKLFFLRLLLLFCLGYNSLFAQDYEVEKDGLLTKYWWYDDEEKIWYWDYQPGTPWPPGIQFGDPSDDNELDDHEGEHEEEDDWDDNWDDDDVDDTWDDWWGWWEQFWDLNRDKNSDPQANGGVSCPKLMALSLHPNGNKERNRTTVGIGEEFRIYVRDICKGRANNWEILNSGTEGITIGGGDDYTVFSAGFKPGTMTIKTTIIEMDGDCASCPVNLEITITVIQPSEVRFSEAAYCSGTHDYKRPSAGFVSLLYLFPETVNFYKVKFKERNPVDHNKCTGAYWVGLPCKPSTDLWECRTTVITGLGTASQEGDDVYLALFCNKDDKNPTGVDAKLPGFLEWTIDYVYMRNTPTGDEEVVFATQTQSGRNYGSLPDNPADMIFLVMKGNERVGRHLNDPEICPAYKANRCH